MKYISLKDRLFIAPYFPIFVFHIKIEKIWQNVSFMEKKK
jgi:hypothetical protein